LHIFVTKVTPIAALTAYFRLSIDFLSYQITIKMSFKNIGPEEFNELRKKEGYKVIDVRAPEEKAEGFIEGAQMINFFDPAFPDEIQKLEKGNKYLLYCRSGNRSGQACLMMSEMGFEDLYNLDGGIGAWNTSGLS
jgi:rhodanese-related sulfurtransferase